MIPTFVSLLLSTVSAAFIGSDGVHAASPGIVNCWDSERGIVQRTHVSVCHGKPVSDSDARALRDKYARDRRARLNRADARLDAEAARPLKLHSAGTGFSINRTGTLLTSAHVIRGCDAVELRDGERLYPATVVAMDDEIDLALVRTDWRAGGFLRFAPYLPQDGEPVALIGFPLEGRIRLTPRLTPVHIAYDLSDPDARGLTGVVGDVRRGNSGGPALDSRGRIIGVLKAKIDSVAAHRLSGAVLKHLGVLVDTRRVVRFLERERTSYWLDGTGGTEQTSSALFANGSAAVARLDCLKRR